MNREEYEREYQRIETGVAIGAMTWRTGMAKVALLSIDFGRAQAESAGSGMMAAEARVRELEDMLQDADNANLTALRRAELDLSGERANHDCTVADAQKAINKLESELAQLRERERQEKEPLKG